jgi:DNA-binding cell septation regulator SpoVG
MHIIVNKYHKFEEGSKIKGVADITITIDRFPFTINGVKIISNQKGGVFYALPQREYEKDGEKKYAPICGFFTKDGYQQFHSSITGAFNIFFQKNMAQPKPVDPPPHTFQAPSSEDNCPF